MFHFLLALVVIGVKDAHSVRGALHNGWWGPKFLVWVALMAGFVFLPDGFLKVYPWISLVGSVIFTVIQLFMLIDFAHTWNDSWVDKYQETNNKNWYYLLVSATVVFLLLASVGTVLMYVFFHSGGADCPYNTINLALISTNLGLVLVSLGLVVAPAIRNNNPRASIFTAAIVAVYSTYLVGSAIFSEPVATMTTKAGEQLLCDYQAESHNVVLKYLTLVLGALITFVAVAFSSMSAGSHSATANSNSSTSTENTKLINRGDDEDEEAQYHEGVDDEELRRQKALEKSDRELLNLDDYEHHEHGFEAVAYNYTWFHVVMLLGSMYIGCLMSNWAVISTATTLKLQVDKSVVSVWLKAASGWVVLLLYIWTVIAPSILKGRDFGYD